MSALLGPLSPSGRLRHDGLFYDREQDLVSGAVAFVREGVERGEMVLVNSGRLPVTALLKALFSDDPNVVFAERPVYATPVSALDTYRRTMDKGLAGGVRGFRAIGHIDLETPALPWQEWIRYEAAVNRVFEGYPFHTLCPYDTTRGPGPAVDAVRRAHPGLVGPDGWRANDEYVDPEVLLLQDGLMTPPHEVQSREPDLTTEFKDLRGMRMDLYSVAMFTKLPRRKVDDLVAAVGEVATNAARHGSEPVVVRAWSSDELVTCTVTDQGPGIDDPLAGFARPRQPSGGLGLWAARQLSDILDYRRTDEGFEVRVTALA